MISKKALRNIKKHLTNSKSVSLVTNKRYSNRLALLGIIVLAAVGALILTTTRAATANLEAESGNISKEIAILDDSAASGGKFITFAKASTGNGGSTQRFPGDPNPLVTGKAYWGASVGGNDDPKARHETPIGKSLSLRRTFWGWGHIGPTGSMTKTATADLVANRLPWVSVKPPTGGIGGWAGMANGTYDADIDSMLVALDNIGGPNKPVWLTIHHEPENENGNATEWRGMQKRIRDRMNALKVQGQPMDNIAFMPIMMDWTYDPLSGRDPNDWWVDGIWDAIGVDPYCYTTCSSKGKFILSMPSWKNFLIFSENKKLPVAVGEWGDTNTGDTQTKNLSDFWNYPFNNQKDVVAFAAFDSGLNPPVGDPGVDTTLKDGALAMFLNISKNDPRVQRVNEL